MKINNRAVNIACAGWSLPRAAWPLFVQDGTHLERYASRFPAVEINSSFYRPHAIKTYQRWADSVPADFHFSVKMPKSITHVRRLTECEIPLQAFLDEIAGLGERLGCVLVQLPPSLAFEAVQAKSFFTTLRTRYSGPLALEPRHISWSSEGAEQLMEYFQIARVTADPVILPGGDQPGGWKGLIYLRLHGSPVIYSSAYAMDVLQQVARTIENYRRQGADVWCIFDNTARGAATANALELIELVQP